MMTARVSGVRSFTKWEWLILFLAAVAAVLEACDGIQGDHAISRLASVYSLSHYGSWYIDNPSGKTPNPFESQTIDKVMVRGVIGRGVIRDGRLVSSKPPLLPLVMTGEYFAMNHVLGWDLDDSGAVPRIVLWITLTLVGGSFLLTLVFFLKTLHLYGIPPAARAYLLVALAFGTQLWGFSGMMNNHVPGAGMLVVALYFALGLASGRLQPLPWRFLVFGFTGALAAAFDMPMGIFVFVAGLALLVRHPKNTVLWVTLGAALPIVLHTAIMVHVTGSPLPVQMRKATYMFETSYWRTPLGIDALNEPKGIYLFHMLVGRVGIFVLFPVLLAGPAAVLRTLRGRIVPGRAAICCGACGFLVLTAYYVLRTTNYGGESYGFRWLIGAMPVLLLMGAPVIATARRRWHHLFLALLLVVSLYSGWECSRTEWQSGQEWTARIFGPPYEQLPTK